MSCTTAGLIPGLQSRKRGEQFSFALDYCGHLAEGETIEDATTEVTRTPDAEEVPEIVSDTSVNEDNTSTVISIVIADDQPYGLYRLEHRVTTTESRQYVESFAILVEP